MKKLLPAACLLLALTACTAAPASSAAAPADTAETAGTTVAVTMDAAAYTDRLGMDTLRTDPLFTLDKEGSQPVLYSTEEGCRTTYDGSRATYYLDVPEGTGTLYVTEPVFFLTEEVEAQSLPAQAGAACEDFTVQDVRFTRENGPALTVWFDPRSNAFPTNLRMEVDSVLYDCQYASAMSRKSTGESATVDEWAAEFLLEDTEMDVQQALDEGTLHWTRVGRYQPGTDVTYQCDALTVVPRAAA